MWNSTGLTADRSSGTGRERSMLGPPGALYVPYIYARRIYTGQAGPGSDTIGRMTTAERERLDRDGYVVLEAAMGRALLWELRDAIFARFDAEGAAAGKEFKTEEHAQRLANLV